MHVSMDTHQIRFRHELGPKAGSQDTLSLRKFGLSDRDFRTASRHIESILQSQRQEVEHLRTTHAWLESIPRKLQQYLRERLLASDPQFVVAQVVSLDESIDLYEAFRQGSDSSSATDAIVMHDVERLRGRCPSDVTRIDSGILGDLLADISDEHEYSQNTLARHAKHWSAFFNWLKSRNVLQSNPCDQLNKVIGSKVKDEVRTEWVDTLVASCLSVEERYWLRLIQWTGCRLREGLSLRVCDIDVARGRIIINETKNERIRVNPLYPAIAEHVGDLITNRDPDERVLRMLTENNCYDWLYSLLERCNIPRWHPPWNAFRSTRANQLASDKTISAQQAGMLLGHSATVARRNYLSVEDSLLERLAQ